MIENKNQLKKRLKENKDSIKIKRIYNFDKNNKIPEGSIGIIDTMQSNAFTIKYDCLDKPVWVYYDTSVEIKDNKIIYYQYVSEGNEEKAKALGVELIPVEKEDKVNADYGKYRNYLYTLKFVYIINEIIESEE